MWMVLTQLSSSIITCAVQAFMSLPVLSEAQSSLFLGVAISVTIPGLACIQDSTQCLAFFPAAIWPALAASGAMAWAWVVYAASLGCQSSYVTLGISNSIIAPVLLALIYPQIMSTFKQTCGLAYLCQGPVLACNTPLHITFMVMVLGLWYVSPFTPIKTQLQIVAVILVIIDAVLVLHATYAIFVCIGVAIPLFEQLFVVFSSMKNSSIPTRTALPLSHMMMQQHHPHAP